jgi:polyphenol oxidase
MTTATKQSSHLALRGPELRGGHADGHAAGHAIWSGSFGDVEVRFVGRGPEASRRGERGAILSAVEPGAPPVAWARQVHSADVLPAVAGECGAGDALWTGERGLALSIATADCVPVLLAGPEGLAAVHAGWRGLAAGILPEAVETVAGALGAEPARWSAWIGPAIGPCCYEVGEDVAAEVARASAPEVVVPGRAERPHLDLAAAAHAQLRAAGVGAVARVAACTRCDQETLWSYRREGKGAGRNLAFIWRV